MSNEKEYFCQFDSEVAGISLVTDTSTGKTDGSITSGKDIRIDGSGIKIAGDENMTGIFFVTVDGMVTKATRHLTQNDPSHILVRVPALVDGAYILRIVTNYSQNNTLLKESRTLEFAPLTIDVGSGEGDEDKSDFYLTSKSIFR